MYKNIKYEELKQLSDDQKKEALQELMTTYRSNSAIAKAIGGVPIAISNMYRKFVEGKAIGRTKGSKNATKTIQEDPLNNVTEIKPKREYTKKTDKAIEQTQEPLQEEDINTPNIDAPVESKELSSLSFTTSLSGELLGTEIKERIIGMVNSLLDNKEYSIDIQITEK